MFIIVIDNLKYCLSTDLSREELRRKKRKPFIHVVKETLSPIEETVV